MGIFSKVVHTTKVLNRISNSVSNIVTILNNAEYEKDNIDNYLIAAWICRVGIIDNMENLGLPITAKISVNISGHNTIITLAEACAMTLGKLYFKANDIGGEVGDAIDDILDKGKLFYEIDGTITAEKKAMFQI